MKEKKLYNYKLNLYFYILNIYMWKVNQWQYSLSKIYGGLEITIYRYNIDIYFDKRTK